MLTQQEFETILADETKIVEGDLVWRQDEDHAPALEFRAEIRSEAGYPLFVVGRYNPMAGTLSFALIHRSAGRIYALDLGADHHNPSCERVGDKHKHRWTEAFRDKEAYVPDDVTAPWNAPVAVWKQFCKEANLRHVGRLAAPVVQQEMPL